MGLFNKVRGRLILKAGLPSLPHAVAAPSDTNASLKKKAPGETKIVAIFGITDWNNGLGHEIYVRKIFE